MIQRHLIQYVATVCGVICTMACSPVLAVDDAQVQILIERLEQAESRIEELEGNSVSETLTHSRSTEMETDPVLFVDEGEANDLTEQLREVVKQNEDLETDYKALTKKFDELAKKQEKFAADSLKGKGFVIPGDSAATMKINARVHADYWAFPGANEGAKVLEGSPVNPTDPEDRAGFRRIRFTMRGDVSDNMFYRFDIEVADPRDFEWRDAFLGFKHLPFNQELVIGNQKRPYGWDHLNSSNDNIFIERPIVIDLFDADSRRLGIQVNGYSDDESWNWHYGLFNSDNIQDSDPFYVSDSYQMEVAGRLANTWWYDEDSGGRGWGHWGIAGSVGRPDGNSLNNVARYATRPEGRTTDRWIDTGRIVGAESTGLIALENVFNAGPVHFAGEIQNYFLERDTGSSLHFWGAYGEVAYMLTGEHMAWNRKTGTLDGVEPFENFFLVDRLSGGTGRGWGAWQVAARYSYMDASDDNILGGEANSMTLGLVWYFNANAKLQFNYVHGWIGEHADLNTAGVGDAEYDILGTRCLIYF